MSEIHLHELDFANADDPSAFATGADHLHWCDRCRNEVAEFQWLGAEVSGTLRAAVHHLPVPTSDWDAVQTRVCSSRHILAGQQSWAILGSAIAVLCLLLVATPMWSKTAFALASASQVFAAAPLTVTASDGVAPGTATPVWLSASTSVVRDSARQTPALASAPRPLEPVPSDD